MRFKWKCCRNVENQVVKHESPKKGTGRDGDYDSDLQAVQWLRNRSNQRKPCDKENGEVNGEENEEEESIPLSVHKPSMAKNSSSSPQIPIDTDGILDGGAAIAAEDSPFHELKPHNRVHIMSSVKQQDDPKGRSTEDAKSRDSNVDVSTRQRYDKADKLLHKPMLEKQKSLTSNERDFLVDLLDSSPRGATPDNVQALESAAQTLENDVLFDDSCPPSPSRSLQHYSPPRRPKYRGVTMSVVQPMNHSAFGEAFELMIRESSTMDQDELDNMDLDDTPLLVIGKFYTIMCMSVPLFCIRYKVLTPYLPLLLSFWL